MPFFRAAAGQHATWLSRPDYGIPEVLALFCDHGIPVPAGNRFELYHERISSVFPKMLSGSSLPQLDIHEFGQSVMEVFLATLVADTLTQHNTFPLQLLTKFLNHEPFIMPDGVTTSRDLSFELYMGCILMRSGCQVDFQEPDIVCQFKNTTIPIACKRPQSFETYKKLARRGANQITKHFPKNKGVVAHDITRFVFGQSAPTIVTNNYTEALSTFETALASLEPKLFSLGKELQPRLFSFIHSCVVPIVCGYKFVEDVCVRTDSPLSVSTLHGSRLVQLEPYYNDDSFFNTHFSQAIELAYHPLQKSASERPTKEFPAQHQLP